MAKIQNLSELSQSIAFTEYDFYDLYNQTFAFTELGRMKSLLPLKEMAKNFGLIDSSQNFRQVKRGRKPYFQPEGKVALMFLKMYTGLSAPKLMQELNGNIHYQIFCGIRINPMSPLTNYKVIDSIILELSKQLRIQEQQITLAQVWKPYMQNLDTLYTDGTCYESMMRYPTDVKLLWDCIEKSYGTMCRISQMLGEHRLRTKYREVEKARLTYAKQRKHQKQKTRHLVMRLLRLLGKILKEIRRQKRLHDDVLIGKREQDMIDVITNIYRQQQNHFESGDARESIPNRIVSVHKPYVRPIVRGKEVKAVEFGAKCNNILIDGISFIEKLSFNAFNEGTRLKHCVSLSKRLFGVEIKKIGGDQGYSSNENRKWCSNNGIETSFVPKGKKMKGQTKSAIRKELARVRATAMEGSFGTQKEHYGLRKVKARIKSTEILTIFFGIHTANLVHLAQRLAQQTQAA